MEFLTKNKITEELVISFKKEMPSELSKRLEDDNYVKKFDRLRVSNLLRAHATNAEEITTYYINLH